MEDLEEQMISEDFRKFPENYYFTFRCISKFWCGVWLVWSFGLVRHYYRAHLLKTTVGLTRGRQISNCTLGQWVRTVPLCISMCEALGELAGTHCETSGQLSLHKDHAKLRQARVTCEYTDRKRPPLGGGHHGNMQIRYLPPPESRRTF